MNKWPLQNPAVPDATPAGGASGAGAPAPPPPLRLDLTSDAEQIAPARKAVEAFSQGAGLGAAAAEELGLVVNEALANVIRHAYRGEGGRPIFVAADCDGSEVRVTIRDWGSGVNPAALPARQPDPATPGGLGLVCLRALTDRAEFAPQPDGMLLTITRSTHNPAARSGDSGHASGRDIKNEVGRDERGERDQQDGAAHHGAER